MTPPLRLTDGVVALRPWQPDDAPFICEACADPDIRRFWIPPAPQTVDDARALIAGYIDSWRRFEAGVRPVGVAFAITDAADGTALGLCDADWSQDGVAELGYMLAAHARGRGAATRAVHLLADWASEMGAARLQLTMDATNTPSRRVAERAGFVYEGALRSYAVRDGRRYDMAWYSLLPGERSLPGDEGDYGDELDAVLASPRMQRLREMVGLVGVHLEADVGGWEKLAIVAPDRVVLFPRAESSPDVVQREADVLDALAGHGLGFVPRLLGRWNEPSVSPRPFVEVSRVHGVNYASIEHTLSLAQVASVVEQLGELVAAWHELPSDTLPPEMRAGAAWERLERWRDVDLEEVRATLVPDMEEPSIAECWRSALDVVRSMEHVVLHGDVCENQLIVDPDTLSIAGVIDWSGATIGHPLADLDFGNWGFGIFAWEEQFGLLRRRMWEAYARSRTVALPDHRVVHLFFSLDDAWWWARREGEATDWQRRRRPRVMRNLVDATDAVTGRTR